MAMTCVMKDAKIICAYPVNLDAVCNIQGGDVSRFIPPNFTFEKIGPKKAIASREDLLSSLLSCMRDGSGAELLIESHTTAREIEKSFSWKHRLGGNAGVMANALASLGARPLLNAPSLGQRLSRMLHPKVAVPLSGALVYPGDAQQAESAAEFADEELIHFVFQFKENDSVLLPQGKITAPSSNRFIATCDPVNTRLISSGHFDAYCLENIRNFDGALLSGFHLVPLLNHRRIFREKISQIKSWKDENPNLFIHLELGSFQSSEIIQSLLDMLTQIMPIDSLGMNEDELAAIEILSNRASPDLTRSDGTAGWQQTIEEAERLQDRLGIFRVAVHTRDYIMSIMRKGMISAKRELSALERGVEAASALAATGSLMGTPPEEVNEGGLRSVREFCKAGGDFERRGAILQFDSRIISITPALVARSPRITVGLGDTATAAIFLQEIRGL